MKAWLAGLSMLACAHAMAGSQQEGPRQFDAEDIVTFAKQTERYLAEHGARVAIISRVGRNPDSLPEGIAFTHTAIAIYSDITLNDGEVVQGYAIHNLYQLVDKPGSSILKTDYPVDFFWGASALKTGIVIPTPALQQRILTLYAEDKARLLHEPDYSVLASPYTLGKQNCTEYTLDVINAALYGTTDMKQLKVNTKAWFNAQPVKVNRMKLRLGSWFNSGISLSDHDGDVKTATFSTIADYLAANHLVQERTILTKAQFDTAGDN